MTVQILALRDPGKRFRVPGSSFQCSIPGLAFINFYARTERTALTGLTLNLMKTFYGSTVVAVGGSH